MIRLRLAVAEADSTKSILLCIVFVGLNILDARLTGVALGLGSHELNPFVGIGFGSSMLLKGLISFEIVMTLVLLKRGGLLKPLSLGMLLICAWNGFAICSWS